MGSTLMNLPCAIRLLWYSAVLLSTLGLCDYDPIDQQCSRWNTQSAVKGDTLYIDGGLETFGTQGAKGPYVLGYNKFLIEVDLSTSWDWDVNISEVAVPKTADPNSHNLPPSYSNGAMFQGPTQDGRLYIYGGTSFQLNATFGNDELASPKYSLWSYSKDKNTWTEYDISAASPVRPSDGAYAEATDQGLGFWLGGQLDAGSQTGTESLEKQTMGVPGMIMVNMTGSVPSARNISTADVAKDGSVVAGSLTYVPPIGDNGILVAMGGVIKPTIADTSVGDPRTFETVDIFDISSVHNDGKGAWYQQVTSGTPPSPRVDYCTISVSAGDKSSHNIYVYGGRDPATGTIFDQVYVLSLPSFIWIKTYQGKRPRYGHGCHFVANRQMITVGGNLAINTTQTCDFHTTGVGILDLTAMVWPTTYNPLAAPYLVAQGIVDVIGGSPSGGSSLKSPTNGFASPSISALFYHTKPSATTSVQSTGSSSATNSVTDSATASAQSPVTKRLSHTGAIAGATLGALAGLALLASGALILLHRKKLRMKQESATGAVEKGLDRDGDTPPPTPPKPAQELFVEVMKSPVVVQENRQVHVSVHEVHELPVTQMAAELDGNSSKAPSRRGSEDALKI